MEMIDLSVLIQNTGIPIGLFIVIAIWSIIWKGLALWKSARNQNKLWFIIILLINTIGIVEILYIFVFSKLDKISKIQNKKQKKKK